MGIWLPAGSRSSSRPPKISIPPGDTVRAAGADIKKRNLDEVALKTTPMEEGGGDRVEETSTKQRNELDSLLRQTV
jgi:hypothetical protein